MRSLVALSGNFNRPSRTRVLVEAIASEVVARGGWRSESFDVLDAGPTLGGTFSKETASPKHRSMWDKIAACDALVIGSPVYKASYTGLLKHFIDLLEPTLLAGKPIIACATGKAPQHALVIEHQFRPLFAFFGSWVLPTGIFATDADFPSPDALGAGLRAKIVKAADELDALVGG
ncbi:MAG: NAD(P)H-dependent oxidoreductase [Mesorhizobium sp.]|uniref:NAD(P)H-dependent oxidoreductase n=1 Tax=Mesorhizobium sp. TaxID=1871066 RepID=UPI001AD46219|nr:NAD(P)H-dependent oxidoreductase [Mesorhizobium sp.]MBN9217274.1 NAD(P)H-dependent oxidoreductase [Mesorhizobium sp.]